MTHRWFKHKVTGQLELRFYGTKAELDDVASLPPPSATLDEVQKWHLNRAYRASGGSVARMARMVGRTKKTLYSWGFRASVHLMLLLAGWSEARAQVDGSIIDTTYTDPYQYLPTTERLDYIYAYFEANPCSRRCYVVMARDTVRYVGDWIGEPFFLASMVEPAGVGDPTETARYVLQQGGEMRLPRDFYNGIGGGPHCLFDPFCTFWLIWEHPAASEDAP